MTDHMYDYIIVGAGLAGASAAKGIRERDEEGSILLVGSEPHPPYDRPPLSKKLWFGQKKVEDIFVEDEDFYLLNNVDLLLNTEVDGLNPAARTVSFREVKYKYGKLLLATGGKPRKLNIPGANLDGIVYFRTLDDYLKLRQEAAEGKSAVVIGGGFIGGEIAAALNINKVEVTMVFPEQILLSRIFPESLGRAIQNDYLSRGVKIICGDLPVAIEKPAGKFVTLTRERGKLESDMVIVGVGIDPAVDLAQAAKLSIDNGIVVNERLQSSDQNVYAAGDNANFPYPAIGRSVRVEHWDNALNQGRHAGLNMAGANEPYTYMPYFFSDLFDFGFEAVGEVDSRLEVVADWQEENKTGTLYYLRDGKVKGAMMCNVWDKVESARQLIKAGKNVTADDLIGAIR